jgi:2-polyprenyl-3-methyl-5-hydroxy-6-metoxy-1,4-benzoquinol methylase
MENIKLKFTGERVVIDDMHIMPAVLQEHIARYNFALSHVVGKKVLDAASGSGYGVDLLSQLAKSVDGYEIDAESIKFAQAKYPTHRFFQSDLNVVEGGEKYDVITSFETIEHLEKPEHFLKWASEHCDTFIFSIPVNAPSEFHKQVWTITQITEMIEVYFPKTFFCAQQYMNFYNLGTNATYVVGIGTK